MSARDPSAEHPLLAELRESLAPERIVVDPEVVGSYVHDEAGGAAPASPLVGVRARTTEDVGVVVNACLRHGVPLVTRGAGTGLSGGANAVEGCVLLSTAQMTEI